MKLSLEFHRILTKSLWSTSHQTHTPVALLEQLHIDTLGDCTNSVPSKKYGEPAGNLSLLKVLVKKTNIKIEIKSLKLKYLDVFISKLYSLIFLTIFFRDPPA